MESWQTTVEEWQSQGKPGKKPSKPRKPKELPPLTEAELAELPSLPEGWEWVRIEEVGDVGTGATPLKKKQEYYDGGTIPWVTSTAVNDPYVREANDLVTELALEETNIKLFPKHTLLVAMYGEGKTRGKCSELLIEATTNQALASNRPARLRRASAFILEEFPIQELSRHTKKIIRWGSTESQPGNYKRHLVPLPSLTEQQAIVEEIEARLSIVDNLEATIDTAMQQAGALRQSILKQAFAGKLVPQDPNDEPAQELLERINNLNSSAKSAQLRMNL